MSLTLRALYAPDRRTITGYTCGGHHGMHEQQITLLTTAVHGLTPLGTTWRLESSEAHAKHCAVLAMLSMQLLGLIGNGNNTAGRSYTIEALRCMYVYLRAQRDELMRQKNIDEAEASRLTTPGFDYFGFDWPRLFTSLV